MADLESISAALDSLETVPASQDPASARGEHEASDVVDQDPNAQVEPEIVQDDEPPHDVTVKDADGDLQEAIQEDVFTEPGPASITEVSKKADGVPSKRTTPASKDKSTALAKSASGKVNSSTPTDKKVRWPCFVGTLSSLLTMCWTGFGFRHVECWPCQSSLSSQGHCSFSSLQNRYRFPIHRKETSYHIVCEFNEDCDDGFI
jgi:hypothetical protein